MRLRSTWYKIHFLSKKDVSDALKHAYGNDGKERKRSPCSAFFAFLGICVSARNLLSPKSSLVSVLVIAPPLFFSPLVKCRLYSCLAKHVKERRKKRINRLNCISLQDGLAIKLRSLAFESYTKLSFLILEVDQTFHRNCLLLGDFHRLCVFIFKEEYKEESLTFEAK